jgi:hypothetical protein
MLLEMRCVAHFLNGIHNVFERLLHLGELLLYCHNTCTCITTALGQVTFTRPFFEGGAALRVNKDAGCPLAGIPGEIRLPVIVVGQLPKMLTISVHHVKIGIPRIIYRHKQNLPAIR